MPEIRTTTPLERMVREAYQTHVIVWTRTFKNTTVYDADRQRASAAYETYTRCIAFELGWVYPFPGGPSGPSDMRVWRLALESVRNVFDSIADQDFWEGDAVAVIVANLLGACVAPEWRANQMIGRD